MAAPGERGVRKGCPTWWRPPSGRRLGRAQLPADRPREEAAVPSEHHDHRPRSRLPQHGGPPQEQEGEEERGGREQSAEVAQKGSRRGSPRTALKGRMGAVLKI